MSGQHAVAEQSQFVFWPVSANSNYPEGIHVPYIELLPGFSYATPKPLTSIPSAR